MDQCDVGYSWRIAPAPRPYWGGSHLAAFLVRTDPRQLDCNRHREGI